MAFGSILVERRWKCPLGVLCHEAAYHCRRRGYVNTRTRFARPQVHHLRKVLRLGRASMRSICSPRIVDHEPPRAIFLTAQNIGGFCSQLHRLAVWPGSHQGPLASHEGEIASLEHSRYFQVERAFRRDEIGQSFADSGKAIS